MKKRTNKQPKKRPYIPSIDEVPILTVDEARVLQKNNPGKTMAYFLI